MPAWGNLSDEPPRAAVRHARWRQHFDMRPCSHAAPFDEAGSQGEIMSATSRGLVHLWGLA